MEPINFLRKLTFRKGWNIFLVEISYLLSNLLKSPIVWGKPWFVSVEPSSACNLGCPQCPVGQGDISRERKYLDITEYEELLREIAPATTILSLYFQGEPLLHKQFIDFVRLASEHGIYTQTSTNGQLLTEEVCGNMVKSGLDRIIVSMDGLDQESYESYRKGGDLKKVEEGIRSLVSIRRKTGLKKPVIILQFLVLKHNQEQLSGIKRRAKQLGADKVWIKSAQIEYSLTADNFIPAHQARYKKNDQDEWELKGRLKNRCRRLWQTTVVTSDGLTVPCCFDKRAQYPMGRITGTDDSVGDKANAGISKIWKSNSYNEFRKKVLSDRKGVSICRNCTEGTGRIYR